MEKLYMLTDSPWLSGLLWFAIVMAVLYFGRAPAQRAIAGVARIFHNALRLAAQALSQAERSLRERNREVLLAAGREAKERLITREFERITATVERDLARYPETERMLSETIQRIDDDHQNATEVPPEVPGWGRALEAVAKVSTKADPTVREVLEAIHGSMARAHERSLTAYRVASRQRHRLLGRMMPAWRRIQGTLKHMDRSVSSILERSRAIDRHMDEFRDINAGSDRAVQNLASSSLVQFLVASLVIAVAVGGALINFSLIARPMTEMVGGTSYIGAFRTADIAALVIILVEISMGLFLMEALRITRLFPVISALPDRTRIVMAWVTLLILTTLATVEAGLAYMREVLLQDEMATTALLRGGADAMTSEALWITTAAQMGMGFILPFALTFVAIPLETFVNTARHVFGMLLALLLRVAAAALRILGNGIRQVGMVLIHLYDVLIFAPLALERRLQRPRSAAPDPESPREPPEPAVEDRRERYGYGEASA